MKPTVHQFITSISFIKPRTNNIAEMKYFREQFMLEVQDDNWILFYDRQGSCIQIFMNTYLGHGKLTNSNKILRLISEFS